MIAIPVELAAFTSKDAGRALEAALETILAARALVASLESVLAFGVAKIAVGAFVTSFVCIGIMRL